MKDNIESILTLLILPAFSVVGWMDMYLNITFFLFLSFLRDLTSLRIEWK